MTHVKITICNSEYKLVSEDSAAYMMDVAREVDDDINKLLKSSDRMSVDKAAVLTAINNADRARKAEAAADNLRDQIKELLDENARLHLQVQTGQLSF